MKKQWGLLPGKFCKAFTLIELLIVVAIIAILAAIAIPNLLEAQIRSKFSRCIGDMRTCVIAMESYRADYGNYFWGDTLDFLRWYDLSSRRERGAGFRLTSPVAYITTIPIDYFNTQANRIQRVHSTNFNVGYSSFFMRGADKKFPNRYMWMRDGAREGDFGNGRLLYVYMLQSAGPDYRYWTDNGSGNRYNDFRYYDPTNGTVSAGDLFYIDTMGWRGAGRRM